MSSEAPPSCVGGSRAADAVRRRGGARREWPPAPRPRCRSSRGGGAAARCPDACATARATVNSRDRRLRGREAGARGFTGKADFDQGALLEEALARARLGSLGVQRPAEPVWTPSSSTGREAYEVVAIAASTGGPGVILEILRALPQNFALPLLLVLHIDEPFAAACAEWLDGQTGLRVAYARDGQLVSSTRGRVTMAPPDFHLTVRGGRLWLSRGPERHSCRPAVDALFESVASEYGASAAACLLTGMGRDGAAGLLDIRKAGGQTMAQDEATSVVYGMPREAVLLDAVDRVLPLGEIGPTIRAIARRARGDR